MTDDESETTDVAAKPRQIVADGRSPQGPKMKGDMRVNMMKQEMRT